MLQIQDLMRAAPVVVPADTPLLVCARHLLDHPDWRMLVAIDQGEVKGLIDDMAVFGNGVMLEDGLWFPFEPEGPDIAGTVARQVPIVEATMSAGSALKLLSGQAALIVVSNGEVVGVVSEHDLMTLAPSVITGDRLVDESASRPVFSVPSSTTARQALQKMGDAHVRHLVVIDNVLTGVVTLRDVVAGWVTPETPVERVRTPEPLTVLLGTSLQIAASLMAERDVGCLPVVNSHGAVVAMLTRSDIVTEVAAASDDEDLFND